MTAVPSISVVIPCYDYEELVGAAIESVLASDHTADEVIVVDDGSSDGSAKVAAGYDGVTVIEKSNGGMASALNRGIAEATGDVVVFLDADDLMAPGRLSWIAGAFADPDVAMAWHPLEIRDSDDRGRGFLPAHPLPDGDLVDQLLREGHLSFAVTSGVAVRRDVLRELGPIPEDEFKNFAESFVVRSAVFHGSVAASAVALGTYRVHSGSDMRQSATADPDQMAAKLARRLRMADTEQRLLCRLAEGRGVHITPGSLHAHDPVYRDLYTAHGRLAETSRRAAWAHARRLELDGASWGVRARARAMAAVYVGLPRSVVARHQLVRSGSDDLGGLTRLWSVVYWKSQGVMRKG